MPNQSIYYWSYDNPKNGDYRYPVRRLQKVADVEAIAPKTTLCLERNPGVTFSELRAAAAGTLDARKGRGVLFSERTGNAYVIDNRGNRKGQWVRHGRGFAPCRARWQHH
jgi:hypothetical protein